MGTYHINEIKHAMESASSVSDAQKENQDNTPNPNKLRDQVFKKMLETFRKLYGGETIGTAPGTPARIENLPAIFESIVQSVSAIRSKPTGTVEKIELDLFPKDLGRLRVELTISSSQLVNIVFIAEEDVKKALKENLAELETRLEKTGILSHIHFKETLVERKH